MHETRFSYSTCHPTGEACLLQASETPLRRRVGRPPVAPTLAGRSIRPCSTAPAVASGYQVVLWQEDGEFYGRGLELPLTMNDGRTADACVTNVRDAMVTTVATMLERGETPPPPANEQRRTEQVNVRLTVEEKLVLDAAASRGGAGGVSEFVREAAMARATAIGAGR